MCLCLEGVGDSDIGLSYWESLMLLIERVDTAIVGKMGMIDECKRKS